MSIPARVTIIWFGFFVLAFVNGALREFGIKKFVDEPWAHHLSAFSGIFLFFIYLLFVWEKTKIETIGQAVAVGSYWFVLTVFAETFIVGRLIGKQSWDEIFSAYNIFQGNLWPLVLAWVGVMPIVFLKVIGARSF